MIDSGFSFCPLYWIYHDQWGFRDWYWDNGYRPTNHRKHRGHVHFFMPDFNIHNENGSKQAYDGEQIYKFKLEDLDGPNSGDPNQAENIRIIGLPKWKFQIKEYWRRVYIQPWDNQKANAQHSTHMGRQGIKYDASKDIHTFGPFRECIGYFFFFNQGARTLPIEYFKNEDKTSRDYFVNPDNQEWVFDYPTVGEFYLPSRFWVSTLDGSPQQEVDGAFKFGYNDLNYIYPTIEYQIVDHLNWERLPGSEKRDINEDFFGDGYEVEVSIPFKNEDGLVQSPFSDDSRKVYPIGTYCHGFEEKHPDRVLKYASVDKIDLEYENQEGEPPESADEWRIPEELKGQPVVFHVPSHMKTDGVWVEQCLGAVVRGKAYVTYEDNFGFRKEVCVSETFFKVDLPFEGADQDEPL